MSPKAKSKGRLAATKLKSRRKGKGKSRPKRVVSRRKGAIKTRNQTAIAKARKKSAVGPSNKIVRIMGHGQFTVDGRTVKKLNDIDNAIVDLVSTERSDDTEFKKRLMELNNLVVKNAKPLDPHEIIKSDIILPSADLSIDEAKKLFRGEGVIPEI
jgi:PspAA-like protein